MLLVDQWIETGGTMQAAVELTLRCGGVIAGITTICMERNFPLVQELKETYKCHEVVPECVHSLFDKHKFYARIHSQLLLRQS